MSEERIKEISNHWRDEYFGSGHLMLHEYFDMAIKQALKEDRELREQDVVEALEWYEEQTRLARLVHSGGDGARQALTPRKVLEVFLELEKIDDE